MKIYSLIMGQVTSRARLKVRLSYCLSGYVSYMYLMLSKGNIKGHLVIPILKWVNLNIVQFWTLSIRFKWSSILS